MIVGGGGTMQTAYIKLETLHAEQSAAREQVFTLYLHERVYTMCMTNDEEKYRKSI